MKQASRVASVIAIAILTVLAVVAYEVSGVASESRTTSIQAEGTITNVKYLGVGDSSVPGSYPNIFFNAPISDSEWTDVPGLNTSVTVRKSAFVLLTFKVGTPGTINGGCRTIDGQSAEMEFRLAAAGAPVLPVGNVYGREAYAYNDRVSEILPAGTHVVGLQAKCPSGTGNSPDDQISVDNASLVVQLVKVP